MTQPKVVDTMLQLSNPEIVQPYVDALTEPKVLNEMMLSMDPKLVDATLRGMAQAMHASAKSARDLNKQTAR
jgi:hypothetical protein